MYNAFTKTNCKVQINMNLMYVMLRMIRELNLQSMIRIDEDF